MPFASTTWGGTTTVVEGLLRVPSIGSARIGHLVIGDGLGAAKSATVLVERANATDDTAHVEIKSDGFLDLHAYAAIDTLTIARSVAAVHDGTTLVFKKWIFAEGFQGFFDTYILIANTNDQSTTATLTFLREADTPVVKTVPVDAFARKTVYAGDYPELIGHAFGIVVEATKPVIAERSMYFGSVPGKLWTGGHVNTGIVAPSTSWFHAEGATGGFFNTFILLSNPQDATAHVELRFLLDTGEVITRQKTIEARKRLTINPATENDARLTDAAVSTVVTSDVAIVSERSMYWSGDATPFGRPQQLRRHEHVAALGPRRRPHRWAARLATRSSCSRTRRRKRPT